MKKTKTKKKVVVSKKTKLKKPRIVAKKKPLKKRKPLYSYTRKYCLEISFGNMDRFSHRLEKEFGPQAVEFIGVNSEGPDLYEDFLSGDDWAGEDRKNEDELSTTGLEYDKEYENKSKIRLVFKTKIKRLVARPLVEALLLSYGFIPTLFRITEFNDHHRIYTAGYADDLIKDGVW